jgi:hypothetical protein
LDILKMLSKQEGFLYGWLYASCKAAKERTIITIDQFNSIPILRWSRLAQLRGRAPKKEDKGLLTLSNFPVKDIDRRTELLSAMAKAQEEDEVEAWDQLLRLIQIPKSKEAAWRQLLESILSQPRAYTTAILQAAMERHTALVGEASPHIEDEAALGLPVMGK